ncbi:MAG: neutral/alkaline non-lysosomal ceramidase N-terminal domain-containing protein [Bacteroidota bacterium]
MKKFFKFFLVFILTIFILAFATLTLVDRTPPSEQAHYEVMMKRLDSLNQSLKTKDSETFKVGYSKVSLTPDSVMALAGYGARRPKEFEGILDSVYIRTIVVQFPSQKIAILSADLLTIHPLMTQRLHERAPEIGWNKDQIFLTATHTHSSIGQWAPGLVGGLFSGEYEKSVALEIADRMIESLQKAEENLMDAQLGYSFSENPDLVLNRLVHDKGEEDPFQKNLVFKTRKGNVIFSSFSAHATCLTSQSKQLSGDFPSYFHQALDMDTAVVFSCYAAGPVGSMGPETGIPDQYERTYFLGKEIANRIETPSLYKDSIQTVSFRVPLELGRPQFKISKNLALRPYLFKKAFGDEPSEISALLLGKVLLIGTPCDFSGELALPLYSYAEKKGLDLILTSFNGGYIGYITKDKWYDMEKSETRTMSWYGPGNGWYFSQIIQKIIDGIHEMGTMDQ